MYWEQVNAVTDQFFLIFDPVNISQDFLDRKPMFINFSQMFIASTENGDCKNSNNTKNNLNLSNCVYFKNSK